ncbi:MULTISPECIES: serine hydrolase domain-containing protein [Pseudoalteromonas]|uniref:Serine hydrolase domain-containing protein n=1 Tax=Pseudoalteromonas obscura TaxID=3048491 RepID=A0ABT7ELW6_9GAMM|nr:MULTISPECIES: serine hydrolase domain-containing protein [Pseudoalteromonas]MBQ4838012.1 beta-lactamase family protein [Pseudoalteromonas luteoviolacea]MDK2596040.1 serine hydrolase domain-containing protein [Pseudoalteromonas sp. P94(2023)]
MQFDDQEIQAIKSVVGLFSPNTELAVAKFVAGDCHYYGARHGRKGVEQVDNRTSVFEIGSLTKLFTCAVLAQMVCENKLSLNDAINEHLAIEIRDNAEISFESLATHTSGLPRLPPGLLWQAMFKRKDNPYAAYLESDLLTHLAHDIKLNTKRTHNYSNLGMGLLGYVLAKMDGMNYGQLLQKRIFEPLNMHRSFCNWRDVHGELVMGLSKSGEPTNNWDLGVLQGAGAVLSTVQDLGQFAAAQFDGMLSWTQCQQQLVYEKRFTKMALGWYLLDSSNKTDTVYFHDGGTGGYSSVMLLDLQNKSGYIILSNISGLHKLKGQKVTKLGFDLMRKLKGI